MIVNTMNRFGEKLHALRIYHGITLSKLAARLGYTTHTYLSEIETGKKIPTARLIIGVARLFNCTTDELMKDEFEVNLDNSRLSKEK